MTLLVMDSINPPIQLAHKHTSAHTRTHTYMIRYPFTSARSAISGYFTRAPHLLLWRLLLLGSAILSLCVTLFLHKEPQSGLIIFGLCIHFAFELDSSVWQSHSVTEKCIHRCKNRLPFMRHQWPAN